MIDRRASWSLPLLIALAAGGSYALGSRAPIATHTQDERAPAHGSARAPSPPSGPLRWIVAGGGASPDLNQVQLEQDIALARETFAPHGPGLTLFAGGPGSRAVQVLDPELTMDPLRARLAGLLAPRAGRESTYRASEIAADGAASAAAILEAIDHAITASSDGPLTVLLAGHGQGGDTPRESSFLTWGPDELWVEDLAAVLDDVPGHRPVRFVITSCYSGGFAELAFPAADPERDAEPTDRCGLFATTFDRAASGCDPNPDRGAQEGYGIHFIHALRGEDRAGRPLALRELDLDGDGAISLLEAHTRARVASGSLDVPVTTSERYLRVAAPEAAAIGETGAPAEERAMIERLSARLGIEPEDARSRLTWMEEELERLGGELDRIDEELARVEEELAASLLHRWPVLDDPWHPLFDAVLSSEGPAIARFLDRSRLAARRAALLAEQGDVAEDHDRLLVTAAPLERIVRALETIELAARLHAEGGPRWARYQALLTCERGRL